MNKDSKKNGTSGSFFTLCGECHIVHAIDQPPKGKGRFDPPGFGSLYGLLDVACAKSVGGNSWAQTGMQILRDLRVKFDRVFESEPFRFGPGNEVYSEYALLVPVCWGGFTVILRISVVPPVLKELPVGGGDRGWVGSSRDPKTRRHDAKTTTDGAAGGHGDAAAAGHDDAAEAGYVWVEG